MSFSIYPYANEVFFASKSLCLQWLIKNQKVQSKHFISELNYLAKVDYTKCESLVRNLRLTIGVGEIEDVTYIVSSVFDKASIIE